jgi:hypothetical protein
MTRELEAAVAPVVRAFEALGIEYSVVGSVASSVHGIGRATLDVDVVADIPGSRIAALVQALSADYYVDLDAAEDAVQRRSMFNAIHLATMLKVDVYVLTDRPFDRASFARRGPGVLSDAPDARTYLLDTSEDTILHKLEWYRAGGEVSERQWNDLLGVLRVQSHRLDREYLARWARDLGLDDLLARAYRDASR